jgi:hypothetical protein
MKLNKIAASLVTAATLTLAGGAANAAFINVGGVVWDPDSFFDFSANSTLVENVAVNAGDTISGYGLITTLNGTSQDVFCPGCELTFVFSGYELIDSLTPTVGEAFRFTGGVFEFFVSARDSDFLNPSTFSNGTPWLSLVASDPLGTGATLTGSLTGVSALGLVLTGEGSGFLDVVGGIAAPYFDTNGQFGADFKYTSEFQPLAATIPGTDKTHLGTATISGASQTVPEPGALALLGIGLLGLGAARRMKKAA